jgi:hypothetical protein
VLADSTGAEKPFIVGFISGRVKVPNCWINALELPSVPEKKNLCWIGTGAWQDNEIVIILMHSVHEEECPNWKEIERNLVFSAEVMVDETGASFPCILYSNSMKRLRTPSQSM